MSPLRRCVWWSRLRIIVPWLLLAMSFRTPAVVSLGGDQNIPTPYPPTFRIQFQTNVTKDDPVLHPINGTLYYDWTQQAQRIDHGAGSYECVHFYQTSGACSLIFLPDGMYRLLHPSSNNDVVDCCLDLPDIGAPPPNWASQPPSTWRGLVWDEFGGVVAEEWWFDRFSSFQPFLSSHHVQANNHLDDNDVLPFHTMRQVAVGQNVKEGLPVVFTFPGKAAGRQDMHFLFHTMKESLPEDPLLFQIPKECQSRPCPQATHENNVAVLGA